MRYTWRAVASSPGAWSRSWSRAQSVGAPRSRAVLRRTNKQPTAARMGTFHVPASQWRTSEGTRGRGGACSDALTSDGSTHSSISAASASTVAVPTNLAQARDDPAKARRKPGESVHSTRLVHGAYISERCMSGADAQAFGRRGAEVGLQPSQPRRQFADSDVSSVARSFDFTFGPRQSSRPSR